MTVLRRLAGAAIDPTYIPFHKWAAMFMLDRRVSPIHIPEESRWIEWARDIACTEDVPRPEGYGTWREWALATLATA